MSIKVDIPQIVPKQNSPDNNGVKEKSAINQPPKTAGSVGQDSVINNLSKQFGSPNSRTSVNHPVTSNDGFQLLGETAKNYLAGNTRIALNANSPGFAPGLNQNLQIAVHLFFNSQIPTVQNLLNNFTSQQIVTSFFLTIGIAKEVNNEGFNKTLNSLNNNPFLDHILAIVSNNNQSQDLINKVLNLFVTVKKLIKECSCAKTVGDLDIIAKKYAKIIQTGDLKTLVKLAEIIQKGQNQMETADYRTGKLLLKLISSGENLAIKNAQIANLNLVKQTRSLLSHNTQTQILPPKTNRTDKTAIQNQNINPKAQISITNLEKQTKNDFYSDKTEASLRKQLDYYPHFAYDRQISAYEKPEEANLGQNEFVKNHYSEIEDWLSSGKHRFVKDFEFDKPLGMIVDRGESGFITADKIRVVLVRDGSVDGWHFLRSFLVS